MPTSPTAFAPVLQALLRLRAGYLVVVRVVVFALAVVSGLGFLAMMGVTCASILMGLRGGYWSGTEDFVSFVGGVSIACALPYTTAVKGHVAVEYFFHKLGRVPRIVTDAMLRLVGMGLFGLLAWGSYRRALDEMETGGTSSTLQIPKYWLFHIIALCCAAVVLTIFAHLVRPGRELVRP